MSEPVVEHAPQPERDGDPKTVTTRSHSNENEIGLQVSVQSETFFEQGQWQIEQAVRVGGLVVALALKDGLRSLRIFDESGKEMDVPKGVPGNALTATDIIKTFEVFRSTRRQGIALERHDHSGSRPYLSEDLAAEYLALDSETYTGLVSVLKRNSGKNVLDWDELKKVMPDVIPPTELVTDGSRSVVGFREGNCLSAYRVTENTGRFISPNKWEEQKFEDLTELTTEDLKSAPWLNEFVPSQNGRLLATSGVLLDDERGVLNLCDPETKKLLFSDASAGSVVNPSNPTELIYLNPATQTVNQVDLKASSSKFTDVVSRKIEIPGTPTDFSIDKQANFFIVTYKPKDGGENRVAFFEAESLDFVTEIENVRECVDIDDAGRIILVDSSNKLRLVNTNMQTFNSGALADQKRERRSRLLKLAQRIEGLELPDLPENVPTGSLSNMPDSELFRALQLKAEATLGPEVEKANTVPELQALRERINLLSLEEEFSDYPEIFVPLEERIQQKVNSVRVGGLMSGLDEVAARLTEAKEAIDLIAIEREFRRLAHDRRGIAISDVTKRKAVAATIGSIQEKLDERLKSFSDDLAGSLTGLLDEARELVSHVSTLPELKDLQAHEVRTQFDAMLSLLPDSESRRGWSSRYDEVIDIKRVEIEELARAEVFEERMRTAQQIEEVRELLEEITDELESQVTKPREIRSWARRNPAVSRYRALLLALPEKIQKVEDERLEAVLVAHRRELEAKKTFDMPMSSNTVTFGKREFPIFQRAEVVWRPHVEPSDEDLKVGKLTFIDNNDRVFVPEHETVPVDLRRAKTKQAIRKHRDEAEAFFSGYGHKVPQFNSNWVLNDHTNGYLEYMSHLLRIQLEDQAGILILEGDAGTGKNVLVDIFSHFTNRETMTFSCNFQTEKEDLTYAFQFDPEKGTYTVDSRLVDMLQTPGSIIVFDEVNTLPPGVMKMLNPLQDYRRTLYLPDGREIKAHDSVIIVGTMNPQHYLGVKPLSQEVVSRSRIMNVDYPPEKRPDGSYAPYEAEMLAKAFPSLRDLTHEEFETAWDFLHSGRQDNGGDKLIDQDTTRDLHSLLQIVKSANRVREAYRAFRENKSTDPVEFVFSLREGNQIASELRYQPEVKTAIQDVILPKVSDPQEKERIRTIIDNV